MEGLVEFLMGLGFLHHLGAGQPMNFHLLLLAPGVGQLGQPSGVVALRAKGGTEFFENMQGINAEKCDFFSWPQAGYSSGLRVSLANPLPRGRRVTKLPRLAEAGSSGSLMKCKI